MNSEKRTLRKTCISFVLEMNFWKGSQQAKKILRLIEEGVAGTSGKHTMRKLCKCIAYFGIIFANLDCVRNILGNGCCD